MEYMNIQGFISNAVSKFLNKAILTKVGFNPNLYINGLSMKDSSEERVIVNLSVSMRKDDLEKLVDKITD